MICVDCGKSVKGTGAAKVKRCLSCGTRKARQRIGYTGGYTAIHDWIRSYFGKADHCDMCGGPSKKFEWSCRNGKPDRNLQNWWQLCGSCHRKYDIFFLGQFKGGQYARMQEKCDREGCDRRHCAKGLCRKHYLSQWKKGRPSTA